MLSCHLQGKEMYHKRSINSNFHQEDLAERRHRPVMFTKSVPNRARVSSSDNNFRTPKEAWTHQMCIGKHTRTNIFPSSVGFKKNIDLESQFQTELSKCLFEKSLEEFEKNNSADDTALLKSRNQSLAKTRPSSSISYWSSQPAFELSQSLWTIKTNCFDPRISLNIKETRCKSAIVQNNEKFDTYFVNGSLDARAVAKSRGPIETSTGNIRAHVHRIKSGTTRNLHKLSLRHKYSDKNKESEYRTMMKLYVDKPPPAPPPPLTPEEKQRAREEALRIIAEKLKAEEDERAAKEAELKKQAEEKAAAEAAVAAASRPSSSGKTVTFNENLTSTKIIGGRKKSSRKNSPARKSSPTGGKTKSFPGSGRGSPSGRKKSPNSSPSDSPKPPSPKGKRKKGNTKGKKGKSKKKQIIPEVITPPVEPTPVEKPEPEPEPVPLEPQVENIPSEPKVILLDDPPKYTPTGEYKTKNKRVTEWLYSCSSAASGTYQPFL
ncbi:uncharacterized protein [Antedon mediterranea]|uniref:uncharacterized protein n=1 Tax=Antedon mediterranea TaxID=105859 RepID=UPI003AF59045